MTYHSIHQVLKPLWNLGGWAMENPHGLNRNGFPTPKPQVSNRP